ncbi:MAG: 4Fe-4S dicluster domain-containing protein, partial [Bacteroidetes bacterium]|nr:4Fe-4S dicluster domain-containing protein [Bacteroidota bacterium]
PIKIEGNAEHPLNRGGLCAAGQAAVLGVYDAQRLGTPLERGRPVSWEEVGGAVTTALRRAREAGGRVRLLSGSICSPTLREHIDALLADFSDARHIMYDSVSVAAMLDAHAEAFGRRALPHPHFDRARCIVSFDADFLGTWISPVEYAAAWARGRDADHDAAGHSWHCQIEGRVSLTGSKADERIALSTAGRHALLQHLAQVIAEKTGATLPAPQRECPVAPERLHRIATMLWRHRGASLLLCGSNDMHAQRLTVAVNSLLGNYGHTLDMQRPSLQKQGDDRALATLIGELREGTVDVLIVLEANPVYDLPDSPDMALLFDRVPTTVVFAARRNESTAHARYVLPLRHALEDWRDAQPVAGLYSLTQPTIPPRRDMPSVIEILAAWQGETVTALDALRAQWRRVVLPQSEEQDFEKFWRTALHEGFVELPVSDATIAPPRISVAPSQAVESPDGDMELQLHADPVLLGAENGGNAWLLELPDPITKVSWENVASVSRATAERLGVENGAVLRLRSNGNDASVIELPALIQEGQADDVIAVALGFGGICTERFDHAGPRWLYERPSVGADGRVGVRAADMQHFSGGMLQTEGLAVRVEKTGRNVDLALAQEYQYLREPGAKGDGSGAQRPCAQETSLHALLHGAPAHGHGAHGHDGRVSMWPEYSYDGHHWGMTIDLSACTGCSACVIGCQVENNIPVVGKDEVRRNRDLHWLRIDRYYFDDGDDLRVVHQPMLCHHCDNAPCETVCPVLATLHSEEGLNLQVYNRCVGTRYCSNNCPYKVRRFNWFDYPRDDGETLVLNPDVTVRSRGVMEKCSFCVQRIQDARIRAKAEDRPIVEGDIQPACMQSCPTRAIRFGDMNNPDGAVSEAMSGPRHYRVLDELGIEPSVGYLMQVRNTGAHDTEEHHG